jgi:hypothetical protein
LSSIKQEDLENIYHYSYRYITASVVDTHPTLSSVELKKKLMGDLTEHQWMEVCRAYTAFFSGARNVSCPPPPLLQPPFAYLKEIKEAGINKFGNGAGKLLAFHLLQLLPFAPSVRIATTADLRHDWCGIDGTAYIS